MRLGIIAGSIRQGRKARGVADWVVENLSGLEGIEPQMLDLKEFDLPPNTSPVQPAAADKQYDDDRVAVWSQAVDACEAFVFVTPEYNHGVPGPFKNAFDSLASEWRGKPVAFVAYGSMYGVRAVEQWRQIVATFDMHDVTAAVGFSIFQEWDGDTFTPAESREGQLLKAVEDLRVAVRRAQA